VLVGVLLPAGSVAPANGQQPAIELKPRFELTIGKRVAKRDVRRVALSGQIGHVQSGGAGLSQITAGSMWLPRGFALHPGEIPACLPGMRLRPGIDGCPDGSMLGELRNPGDGYDGVTDIEDGFTDADYVFVNGGPRWIWAFMTIYKPALVQEPVAVAVHKLRGAKWSYRLDFRIPKVLLVIAWEQVSLRGFDLDLDGIEQAPGYLTLGRRCPKRGHFAYRASLTFQHHDNTTSEAHDRGSLKCRGGRR
jgi:hypothetical protein